MYYSIIGLIALSIHLVMNYKYFINRKEKTEINKVFGWYLWAALSYYVIDSFWGIVYDFHIPVFIYINTLLYYIAMAMSVVLLCQYVTAYLRLNTAFGSIIKYFGYAFAIGELILLIVNHFNQLFFRIDSDGIYHAYELRYLALYMQVLLCIMLTIHTGYVMKKAIGEMKKRYFTIFIFCIEMAVAVILQSAYPLLPFYSIGLLIGNSIIHTFVEEGEKDSQYTILKSMSSIYYSVHVIDLLLDTVEVFKAKREVNDLVNRRNGAVEMMKNVMTVLIEDEFRKAALDFTDLSTLPERMKNKKMLSAQFVGKKTGWFLAMFITTETDNEGKPTKVVFSTRVIDEEKKQEESLLRKSQTDELTGLYNRRAFEDDLLYYPDVPAEQNFVYASIDINGLKLINDKVGHIAGDELIKGAAMCLKRTLGNYGKVYRIGGDEFVSMFFADEAHLHAVMQDLENMTIEWQGESVSDLSLAIGYASKREFNKATVMEMSKIADKRMYNEKAKHYSKIGLDRRGQSVAHTALCKLYTKILKINITDDSYRIINMNIDEQSKSKGFSDKISDWLRFFGTSGQVHPDDLEEYLKSTSIQYMRYYFTRKKTSLHVFYRRKFDNVFKQVMMEIIPADDYSDDNQTLFLYVKNIDK